MKSLEGINNHHSLAAGPLLFAYHPGVGVDDAIHRITFWQDHFHSCRVLEGQWTWTMDYLIKRLQYVRLQVCVSEVVICSIGGPQGTVLCPFLFILYTSDFRYNTTKCHLQKFSDDPEYRLLNLVWPHHLLINTSKMLIDSITVVWTLKYKSIYQTINRTSHITLMLCTRWAKVGFICWAGWGLLECAEV